MNKRWFALQRSLAGICLIAVPLLVLEGLRLLVGAPFAWSGLLVRGLFLLAWLLLAWIAQPSINNDNNDASADLRWSWLGLFVVCLGVGAVVAYLLSRAIAAAWIGLLIWYVLLFWLDTVLVAGRGRLVRGMGHCLLALVAGLSTVSAVQVESRFSDEEFFVAIEALALALCWLLALIAWRCLSRVVSAPSIQPALRLTRTHRLAAGALLASLTTLSLGTTVWAYQRSFYPHQAPGFDGIAATSPFRCGQVAPAAQTYDGEQVFAQLLDLVAAQPNKSAPIYGMLALGTGEERWAEAFRTALLHEARGRRFTEPAQSVKYIQYQAAFRVYYYTRVQALFPNLFTPVESAAIHDWFAAINQRALTVEWVDWLYGLAFTMWPEGPYENQESGAGLLALLQANQLAEPDLAAINQDYLARNQRGWNTRFRNTDDAIV
ncbi:MAG: hypothetical protein MI924_09630, partial [Chloroflexales bacterium]|nr:hypothetical protein [Chloroflexales bacterium]